MPLNLTDEKIGDFPKPQVLTIDSHKRGVVSLIDKSRLPKTALEVADNIFLYEDGQAGPRPGIDWFGTAVPGSDPIEGYDYFDADGDIHIVVKSGTKIYRSTDDAETWDECTGATFTSGLWTNFNQNGTFLYISNGTDNIVRYDGTTTLQVYTELTTPSITSAVKTGLSGTSYGHYYKASRVNLIGFSAASAATSEIQTGIDRSEFNATTDYITLTLPALETSQTRYDIYYSNDGTNYNYLGSTSNTTYVDDGRAIPVPGNTAPTSNTTNGPKVKELKNVGSRQYGIRDTENRYRIWFSGTGNFAGAFATAYDGGYLDWQEGGKYIPMQVEDYRDGKGEPLATVWCDSADGQGCILQMSLDVITIEDISITVPSAYKLPGSRGTPAPGSVVGVLNDYLFYNSQAIYNLGSRAQYLNLLSTDEYSANIRPSVKEVSTAGQENITAIYYDAKVYMSVPVGGTENNRTMIYDTEQKAWLPTAFTVGFSKLLRYVDNTMSNHLLCLKPGDNRLSEIGTNIKGDYGEPFTTNLVTGLYPVSKDRFEFQTIENGQVELSNPAGTINIELIGIERSKGYSTAKSEAIVSRLTDTGWSTRAWSSALWSDTSDAIDTYSESSRKRYFRVNKELNAVQWRISTNTLDASYVTRTLQTIGTDTQAGMPREWKL